MISKITALNVPKELIHQKLNEVIDHINLANEENQLITDMLDREKPHNKQYQKLVDNLVPSLNNQDLLFIHSFLEQNTNDEDSEFCSDLEWKIQTDSETIQKKIMNIIQNGVETSNEEPKFPCKGNTSNTCCYGESPDCN